MNDPIILKTPKIEISQEIKKKKEYKLIGRITLKKGMKLFSYFPEERDIEEVKIQKKGEIGIGGKVLNNAKAEHKSGTLYIQALNKPNALRKLTNLLIKAKKHESKGN